MSKDGKFIKLAELVDMRMLSNDNSNSPYLTNVVQLRDIIKAKKVLDKKLAIITKNSKLLNSDTKEEKSAKELIIIATIIETINDWITEYFGE
jgi:hypothetical protein